MSEQKLISKLIRIEEGTINDIESLKEKFYKDEYISFSSVVRKLIRLGIESFNKDKDGDNK